MFSARPTIGTGSMGVSIDIYTSTISRVCINLVSDPEQTMTTAANNRQWTRRMLLSVMSISSCYRPQSVVTDNGYRWTDVSTHCGWQWPAMETLRNLLSLAIYIDICPPRPLSLLSTSIDSFPLRLLSLTVNIDILSSRLLTLAKPTRHISPSSYAAGNINR